MISRLSQIGINAKNDGRHLQEIGFYGPFTTSLFYNITSLSTSETMTLPQQYTIVTPYIVGPVHCYSAMLGGELVLFDCGPPTMECRQFLKENIDLARVRHVIITHGHIDHWGQALWLAEQGITVYLPLADHLKISRQKRRQQEMLALLDEAGFSTELMAQFNKICKEDVLYPSFPPGYKIVEYDLPKELGITVHSCPGHSVSDLVFAGDGWIVSGDTLLEGVFQSPLLDVDLQKGGRFQNYLHWCETIVTLAGLEGNTICPGHRDIPQSVCQTIIEYIQTLLYRTGRFLPYQHESDLMRQIEHTLVGRIKGPFHIYLKASEIIFIKDLLANPEPLIQALKTTGLYPQVGPKLENILSNRDNCSQATASSFR